MEMEESKKIDKFSDLAKEQNNLWNMKVALIPIIFGTVRRSGKETRGIEDQRENRGHPETTDLLRLLYFEAYEELIKFAVASTSLKNNKRCGKKQWLEKLVSGKNNNS